MPQQNPALKGLMQAAPVDQQINQLQQRNQMLSGTTPQPQPMALPPAPDRPGLQGPQRTGDIELPAPRWAVEELMRRARAITGQ